MLDIWSGHFHKSYHNMFSFSHPNRRLQSLDQTNNLAYMHYGYAPRATYRRARLAAVNLHYLGLYPELERPPQEEEDRARHVGKRGVVRGRRPHDQSERDERNHADVLVRAEGEHVPLGQVCADAHDRDGEVDAHLERRDGNTSPRIDAFNGICGEKLNKDNHDLQH